MVGIVQVDGCEEEAPSAIPSTIVEKNLMHIERGNLINVNIV